MDRVGHSVIRLKRVKIGPLSLGDLPIGTYRHLTSDEVKTLRATAIEDKSQKSGIRSQKSGVGSRKSGIRSQKSGVGSRKPGISSQKPGVRSEKPGIRSRKPEVRSQKSGQGKNQRAKKFQRPPR
jgi:hypothetical protein